jgi:hypothetical protein
MIMPSEVHVTRAADLEAAHRAPENGATVTQRDAIVNKCDRMCASGKSDPPSTSDYLAEERIPSPQGRSRQSHRIVS